MQPHLHVSLRALYVALHCIFKKIAMQCNTTTNAGLHTRFIDYKTRRAASETQAVKFSDLTCCIGVA